MSRSTRRLFTVVHLAALMLAVAEGKLRERFPTPEWLRKQYDEAAQKREARRKTEEPSRPSEEPSRPSEEPKAEQKPRPPEEKTKPNQEEPGRRSRLGEAAETVASGSRFEGAKRVSDDLPVAAAVVGGAVLAVGAVSLAAWVTSREKQKGQP